jgi:hypothetical protein
VERVVNAVARVLVWAVLVIAALPNLAGAQFAPQPSSSSNLWLVAGGGFSTLRGDCQTCEEDYPYRHGGSILANAGYRVTERMDVGAEVFWMPVNRPQGTIRTTHFDAVAQFRPWRSQGFFLKGGAGLALVRNWVDVTAADPINSKAFSLVIGGGWAFRPARRFGAQVYVSQHAGAMGDLTTAADTVQDVIGNFWSTGMAIVIR